MSAAEPFPVGETPPTLGEQVARHLVISDLPPIVRTLMTTDGTVTETLSAFFGEPVQVRVLSQGFRAYQGQHHQELEAKGGARLLDRAIVLFGADSGTCYAAASSRIVPSVLPSGMQEALLSGTQPLGRLMLEYRLETFKEIVTCGRCQAGDTPHLGAQAAAALSLSVSDPVVWRTYRVISGGRPIMSITEVFPAGLSG